MDAISLVVDVLLVGMTVLAALAAVASRDVFRAVAFFIVFGALMALIWLRLSAPDVALAEAAVGAGLTGVLMLETLGRIRRASDVEPVRERPRHPAFAAAGALALAGASAAAAAVAMVLERAPEGLAPLVAGTPGPTENPVTAVLLDFRGYDTLLEIAVLLLAVIATMALYPRGRPSPTATTPLTRGPERGMLLGWFVRMLLPVGILVAGYLWWQGADAPGGAFQGGTVLAAVLILMLVTAVVELPSPQWLVTRLALAVGLLAFLAVAAIGLWASGAPLDHPSFAAKPLILALEAVLTVAIAACLAALVIGIPHVPPRRPSRDGA